MKGFIKEFGRDFAPMVKKISNDFTCGCITYREYANVIIETFNKYYDELEKYHELDDQDEEDLSRFLQSALACEHNG